MKAARSCENASSIKHLPLPKTSEIEKQAGMEEERKQRQLARRARTDIPVLTRSGWCARARTRREASAAAFTRTNSEESRRCTSRRRARRAHVPASRCFHNEQQQRVGAQAEEAFAQQTPERGPNSPDNNAKLRDGERQAKERANKNKEKKRQRIPNRDAHSYGVHVSARHAHTSPACARTLLCLTAGHQRRASASEECTRVSAGGRKEDDRRSAVPHEKAPPPRGRGQRRDFAPQTEPPQTPPREECLGTTKVVPTPDR